MEHNEDHKHVSLGFTNQEFEPGVHICQIFNDDDERSEAFLSYILSGLKGDEKTICFSEKVSENDLNEFLRKYSISYDKVKSDGDLVLAGTESVYFQDGNFNPERMLALLTKFHEDSIEQGYSAARVIGEMSPKVQDIPGGNRLLEYESKVSMLLREHPVTAVCQYDARSFDGATIMDILKVHPYMIVRGSVVHNPFYISPEDFFQARINN